MNASFIPILVVPAVPYKEGVRFLHRKTQIDVGQDMASTLWKILSFTNGYNTVSSIARLAELPEDKVSEILSELYDMELVVDSRKQFLHFHKVSNYPSTFNSNLSQKEIRAYEKSNRLPCKSGAVFDFNNTESALFSIRKKRRSCRNFSKRKMTVDQIGSICNFAYSIHDHSTPSGGALYPLRIYMIIENDQEGLTSGYYEYDAEHDNLILFNKEVDEEQLRYCFNQEDLAFGSSVQIVIAADLERQSYKYANRGYRLTLVEAGHVAENISLYCAEQNLGTCEMGGVQDEPLKQELELDKNVWPILTISIGYSADSNTNFFNKVSFVEEHTGENHAVKEYWAQTFGLDGSFFGATTVYEDASGRVQFAGATSPAYDDAIFKATVEAYERWLSGQVRVDFYGPAKELNKPWVHPKFIAPLTEEQAEKSGVVCFSEDLPINWTKGTTHDGSDIYVPSAIVYYGQKNEDNTIYFGHSSGIAAYSNLEEAKKRALTELIERDAIMRNWYTRKTPSTVSDSLLSVHAKKRIQHWAKQNRRLSFLQMPSEYGWVFEAIIVSDEYPCFISGAAATIDRELIENTIIKALQEAEYNLLLALKEPVILKMEPQNVSIPLDHGQVYYFKDNAEKLNWLWNGPAKKTFEDPKISDYEQLLSVLKVSIVDLSDNSDLGLKVVRAFSPELVPINFGFNSAHYTHPSLKGKVDSKSLEMPHYFA